MMAQIKVEAREGLKQKHWNFKAMHKNLCHHFEKMYR